MRTLLKKYGRYIGYALFTVLMTLYFSVLTFPYDALKDRVLARQIQGFSFRVSIESIRATPLLWIRASGIDVTPVGNPESPVLKLREARLRPSLLRALIGRPAIRIHASLYGGKVRARAEKAKEEVALSLEWKDIAMAQLPVEDRLPGAELKGRVNGELDLTLRIQGEGLVPGDGVLKASLAEGSVRNLQVMGIALPALEGIQGQGEVSLGQNRATVEALTLNADLLAFSLEGRMDVAKRLTSSPLNLKAKVKLSGPLASQYQPMLAGFLRKQDAEGFYVFSIRGTLGSPRLSL
jgi:type II secretion system protein N